MVYNEAMRKHTKITATIGPASDSEEMITALIEAGVNVFRFNFKHNTVEWHGERIERVRAVSKRMGIPVGTLIDLQGPEIRITVPSEKISLTKDEQITLAVDMSSEEKGFSIPYPQVIQELRKGQRIIVDDGAFTFVVEESGERVVLRSESQGTLPTRKSMNVPGLTAPLPVLVERDYDGLSLAKKYAMEFVALSFVRTKEDILILREEMKKQGIISQVVSKIEAQQAIANLDAIIQETDVIMVARGDLGVEYPVEEVPYYQKIMIRKCIERGIPVITATQMLQSMIQSPSPTRAEVSDVANAAYDLTDSVMLSGETASGSYPLETVQMMARTVAFNETKFPVDRRTLFSYDIQDMSAMMCSAAYGLSLQCFQHDKAVTGFLVFTTSGRTAQFLARYRPHIPIYAFTDSEQVRNTLSLTYGVMPFTTKVLKDHFITKEEVQQTIATLKEAGHVRSGERLIMVYGDARAEAGMTDTIKVVDVS